MIPTRSPRLGRPGSDHLLLFGARLAADEIERIGVEHIGIDRQHAVRIAGVNFQRGVRQQLRLQLSGILVRYDLVVVTVRS